MIVLNITCSIEEEVRRNKKTTDTTIVLVILLEDIDFTHCIGSVELH